MRPGVVFDGVWKKFRKGERHDSLRDLLPALARRALGRNRTTELEESEFWALEDVMFSVGSGEALGIIGPNGAGKSTILKLLTNIIRPTRGTCRVSGRIGALIEIAAGFHPDLTGRENVFLQGSVMGMKQADIARKFDEIVAFGGVGDFIDTPVKRYSSGMNARLGFSIAAHLDPDVLLIDEVLSVGDTSFRDRCTTCMRTLVGRGTPLVFISHDLPSVIDLCTRVIVLDHGKVQFDGDPGAAVQHYRAMRPVVANTPENVNAPIRLVRTDLLDAEGRPSATFRTNGDITVRVAYAAKEPLEATFHLDIHRADGVHCAGFNNFMDHTSLGMMYGEGHVDIRVSNLPLLPGSYVASVWILDHSAIRAHQKHLRAYPFSVVSDETGKGVIYVNRKWSHRVEPAAGAETEVSLSLAAPFI